jgi:PucR C-terminal helix-turn-helix domain
LTTAENNQHRKATAASLGIYLNTLSYRLDRIEALLGAKLDAPGWIAPIFIALKMRDVGRVYPGGNAEIVTTGKAVIGWMASS